MTLFYMLCSLGQKVRILSNSKQLWTIGKIGTIARVETEVEALGKELRGMLPWYYVEVRHSQGCWSRCILISLEMELI